MIQYILELSTLDYSMLHFPPSHVAAAAVMLSNELACRCPAWPAVMADHSRKLDHELQPCAQTLRELLKRAPSQNLQSIPRKFGREAYFEVAPLAARLAHCL